MSFLHRLRKRYGRAGRGGTVDARQLDALDLYAENTSELYNQKLSILANIKRRITNGTYDPAKAPKLWMYWVDVAARRYAKEFKHRGFNTIFNKATREALAKELANHYRTGELE